MDNANVNTMARILMLKGKDFNYDELTEEQKNEIRDKISHYFKVKKGTYVTTLDSENVIPINVVGFKKTDLLSVYINGLRLIEDVEYHLDRNNQTITLFKHITTAGTPVHFVALDSVALDYDGISRWMNEHPEATTTVQDGSISLNKLGGDVKDVLNKINLIVLDETLTVSKNVSLSIENETITLK